MLLEALGNSVGEVIRRLFELHILCILVAHVVVSLDNLDIISFIPVVYVGLFEVTGAIESKTCHEANFVQKGLRTESSVWGKYSMFSASEAVQIFLSSQR
tara:strand:- start:193 stop:492 length:300 start_codon:yes stop_codon:yes gene_type:complete